MPSTLYIDIPEDFSFRATVYSHGWCELAPFALDTESWRLSYVFSDGKNAVPATIYEEKKKLRIDLANNKIKADKILRDVRHILRLDDDLSGLYAALADNERLAWVAQRRAGRLLRSPTVWEDLVKTICTTNCSWHLTKIMVNNLVEKISEPPAGAPAGEAPSGVAKSAGGQSVDNKIRSPFPTPQQMATRDEQFYRAEIKAGYRAPYFTELAGKVSSGELDPEQWLHSDLPTPELKKEIKKVKGVGDYAADNLLKLVGRYDGLALDSWLRSQFYKNHNKGRTCKDIKIERHYKKYGEWRGLVIWCDMTEKWIT